MRNEPLDTIRKYSMISAGDRVIVGLSGGADSVTLLHYLNSCREALGAEIRAAHVNHMIRGDEADRDEEFVRQLCRRENIHLDVLRFDVPATARSTGEGLEECGRRIRYDFFNTLSGGKARIATAHNLNDSMETFIMNLCRGASLKGLCGIPPVRGNIIRPLIFTSRTEIEEYCKENALEYVTDSTNSDCEYTRNKIRCELLPVMFEINPSLSSAFLRCTENLSEDEAYLSQCAAKLADEAYCGDNRYNSVLIAAAPEPLKKRAVVVAFARAFDGKIPENRHINTICSMLSEGGKAEIYGNCFALVHGGVLEFAHAEASAEYWEIPIKSDFADCAYPYGTLHFRKIYKKDINNFKNINNDVLDNLIDCDKINVTPLLRCRKEGDSFRSGKRHITKKLKNLYNEAHIPLAQRNRIPLISDGDEIVWIKGFGVSEKYAASSKSESCIQIIAEDKNNA
ncbi:MAG: tRNA lysidine(34) synthetase TilS [Clostridiales bacterium]|nr:tRNA lysidine(34) synthetase TilS [Clostridiales bacterium]